MSQKKLHWCSIL